MHNSPAPDAASSLPSQRVRAGIARGEKYACTIVRGSTIVCLRAAVAWCPKCEMPRCAEDSVGGCVRCGFDTVSFETIRAAASTCIVCAKPPRPNAWLRPVTIKGKTVAHRCGGCSAVTADKLAREQGARTT